MAVDSLSMNQFVNPQDTDKRSGFAQFDLTYSGLCVSTCETKPSVSRVEPGFRRPSLTISDTRSLDSSTFESSPGCLTPCTPVSATSSSSSRRQSMAMPAHQQYYLSPGSPSPVSRSPRSKRIGSTDHYSLQQPFTPEAPITMTAFMINGGPSYCLEEHFPMMNNEYTTNTGLSGLPCHQANDDFMSECQQVIHPDSTASLSADMARNFSFAMGGQVKDFAHPFGDGSQTQMYHTGVPSFEVDLPHMAIDPMDAVRSLDAPFEYNKEEHETQFAEEEEEESLSATTMPSTSGGRKPSTRTRKKRSYTRMSETSSQSSSFSSSYTSSKPSSSTTTKPRPKPSPTNKKPKRSGWSTRLVVGSSDKKHPCTECNAQGLNVRFVRPEHLVRHKKSHHEGEETVWHACKVPGCIDPKSQSQKKIKARGDNLAPHYNNTHFSWGNSDHSGKNRRISLKESQEIDLLNEDSRWVRFLEGRIVMDGNPKGEWKMLGYSIRETRDILVKDVVAKCPTLLQQWNTQLQAQSQSQNQNQNNLLLDDTTTLKDLDFRWKMLIEGTMDFETCIAEGHKMKEYERKDRGLLGVSMLESEEMGLRDLDPRWMRLRSGGMSEKESEILGVKHLNTGWGIGQMKRGR